MTRIVQLIALSVWAATFTVSVKAQDRAQDPQEFASGLRPFGTYSGGDIDSVSAMKGNLTVRIPLWSYPQRGGKLKLDFNILYTSQTFSIVYHCDRSGNCFYSWKVRGGIIQVEEGQKLKSRGRVCLWGLTSYSYGIVDEADGTSHMLGNIFNSSSPAVTLDATGIRYDATTGGHADRTGVRYFNSATSPYPRVKEDPNGNQIVRDFSSGWTDSVGRQIPLPPYIQDGLSGAPLTDATGCTGPRPIVEARLWNIPGPNGGTVAIKFCKAGVPTQSNFADAWWVGAQPVGGTIQMLQSIVLPDGTAWTFEYDDRDPGDSSDPASPNYVNYGQLTKITFPTGGTLSYTWTTVNGTSDTQPLRIVASRTLNANDGAEPATTAYTWSIPDPDPTFGGYPQPFTNVMTDPYGNDTVFTVEGLPKSSGMRTSSLYVTQTQYYQGSRSAGTLLKTVRTDYSYYSEH